MKQEPGSTTPDKTSKKARAARPGLALPTAAADASAQDQDLGQPARIITPAPAPRSRELTHRWEWIQFIFFLIQLCLDIAAIISGFLAAYYLRRRVDLGGPFMDFNPGSYTTILLFSVSALLIAFNSQGLYHLKRGYSKIDEFYRICAATFLGLVLAVFFNSMVLGPSFNYSRIILLYSFILIIVFSMSLRWVFSLIVAGLRRLGVAQVRMIIVGAGDATARIARKVQATPELGYRVAGQVCDRSEVEHDCPSADNITLLGHIAELPALIKRHRVSELIIAVTGASQRELFDIVARCDDLPVNIRIYPEAFQLITTTEVSISALTGLPLVSVKDVALRGVNRVIKRGLDILISSLILILLSPVMLLLAALIKITDPHGPVFYTQQRVGLDGKPFTVLKFRSMRSIPSNGQDWTTENDPRRTGLGRFIRRFSLDELPQFINVLLGDMSVVGPRPEQPKYVEQFSQTIPRYMRRHKEKAGITGWAQVNGLRGDTSIEERTRYDLYYVENWSVLFDLKIMLKTIIVLFTDKNAY